MSRSLVPTWSQKEKIAQLVNDLGVLTYRDAKAALGIGRMKPFQRLNYAEAMQIIEMMESLKKERFGDIPKEHVFNARSHQPRTQRPAAEGLLEPTGAGERSER